MWRRVRLISWEVRITKYEKESHLLNKKLGQAHSGALDWALEGYGLYLAKGLEPPTAIQEATAQYRDDINKVTQFMSAECVTSSTLPARKPSSSRRIGCTEPTAYSVKRMGFIPARSEPPKRRCPRRITIPTSGSRPTEGRHA
jgi:hypothetical protein